MKNYNDEMLSPHSFECMAKEYFKQLKGKEISINHHNKLNQVMLIEKINQNLNAIQKEIGLLKQFNLSNHTRTILNSITEKIKYSQNEKISSKNYCQTLNSCINYCCKICELVFELQQEMSSPNFDKYKQLFIDITNIVPQFSQMYGQCKYREI